MFQTAKWSAPRRGTDHFKYLQYRNNRPFNFSIKSSLPSNLESRLKSWAVDKMAERFFQGKNTPEHRHASRFWMKSGRRLKHV